MLRSMIRMFSWICLGSFLILAALPLGAQLDSPTAGVQSLGERIKASGASPTGLLIEGVLLVCAALAAGAAVHRLLPKLEPFLDSNAAGQAHFLDKLDSKYVDLAIVGSAALSLFLELALIRWQSSILAFLAFYKNFTLIACFAGLGLGYALASRSRIPLLVVIPLLVWQFGFMLMLRFVPGLFHVIPFREQLSMGVGVADLPRAILLYALLTVIFLSSAMIFLPVGQLCGRLLERRAKLKAYGLNLLGSLVGVVLMMLASSLWTPPPVWFAACFLGVLLFFNLRESRSLIVGLVLSSIGVMILAWWPIAPLWNRIYSPYQLVELGADKDTGLTTIRAAGHYYQNIYDLSGKNLSGKLAKNRDYYDLPYSVHPGASDVAVVGAGTGNDVAAALRAGAARVDAVEIDPAILLAGVNNHPEKPYSDPRTVAVNDDARSFLRHTNRRYDLIVYGLLDSHTLLSHGSSVRLDSFVYTIEGLREARNRLKADGLLSLSFTLLSDVHQRKVNKMLQQVFDGRPPACIGAGYDGAVVFLASNDPKWTLPPKVLEETGFMDLTTRNLSPALRADVSTDDWPFFYMPRRVYPVSYLIMIVLILALSVSFVGNFMEETPRFSHLSFFFLGAGFMLVETKGITEMGLTFGNTWQVIGFVIAGILIMAFLGNCAVDWLKIQRPLVPYVFLWITLAAGWLVSKSGGFPSTPLGRLGTVVILTCPLLFSGIVFSTLLSTRGQVSGIMAANLLGAICGGLLEYNSMYFGFRSLYVIAMVFYMAAFLSEVPIVSRITRLREV